MDRFGQIGPEKGDYSTDVDRLAELLTDGAEGVVTFALTHRLTRQQVTVALKSRMGVYGGGPEGVTGDGLWTFVAVQGAGAYWFRIDFVIDAGYLAQSLGGTRVDAETLVDFLARLAAALGVPSVEARSVVTEVTP